MSLQQDQGLLARTLWTGNENKPKMDKTKNFRDLMA